MKAVFHPEAEREFNEAAREYAAIDSALGTDFVAKVEESVIMAMAFPQAWKEVTRGVRRSLLRRFPYGILYAYDEDVLYVLAVMHLHQKPGYWKNRLK